MSADEEPPLVRELRAHIHELERQIADLTRRDLELREAITALMEPDTPRILHNSHGLILLDKPLPPRWHPVDN